MKPKPKQIVPLPFAWYFVPTLLLALAGFANSVYLAIAHYRVHTDLGYESFCAISRSVNCDTVSQSLYSIFLGVPVPIWGIFGYGFFILLMGWKKHAKERRLWALLFLLSSGFSLYSVLLAYISSFLIHSYCLMCIVGYGISFLLVYYVWLIRKRFEAPVLLSGVKSDIRWLRQRKKTTLPFFLFFGSVAIMMMLYFPAYWISTPPANSDAIPRGITEEGYPWIGAANPRLTISEFSDYRCFQCKKMHIYLRKLVLANPDNIRLIHRHFPMDHEFNPLVKEPYHVGAGKLSLLSILASQQGKFWEMNDLLYGLERNNSEINVIKLAEECRMETTGMPQAIYMPDITRQLMLDIYEGIKLGIDKTPGYLIDGKVYTAYIPPSVLKVFIGD
jgi:uncharacterized membrane protein/protein-disulfide isomerase